jgi:hypothetical protein
MIGILITSVPHESQRYNTVGDWFSDNPVLVRVSDLNDSRFELLVALHELVEMSLCQERGITAKDVDEFDFNWKGEGEPGDDPAAPYFKEHQFASIIERMMAHELGVDWQAYNKKLDEQGE